MHHQSPLYKKIKHAVGRAVADFDMIREGDRILVAVSGGKDSLTLLQMLASLRERAPISYDLIAATVDSGYPGFDPDLIASQLTPFGIPFHIEQTDHYDIIQKSRRPGSSFCSFCARLKRGVLYTMARRLECNKLALGHHSDDFIETLLLNQFFVGSLKAMSARMLADDGQTTVIRPLVYVGEKDIISHAKACGIRTVTCNCPLSGPTDQQRQRMKQLINDLERENPFIRRSLLAALANVHPRHLLDGRLWQEPEARPCDGQPAAPDAAATESSPDR